MAVTEGSSIVETVRRTVGLVRVRQIADRVRHRLSFIPMIYVFAAILLVELLLFVDRSLSDKQIPGWLETTVDSARSVFSAMAGGLITSITLLLSMMLVAVQLASSQFSPRTLRDWLGNRTLQHALGVVLGTTVFCLLALRSTRDVGDDSTPVVPHVTVLTAVVLGVISLVAVVRAVDHMTHSVRVGAVAERVATDTISVVERSGEVPAGQSPASTPSPHLAPDGAPRELGGGAVTVETNMAGWIQQIDEEAILANLPEGATAVVPVNIGGFVPSHAPLIWVDASVPIDAECRRHLLDSFAIGDSRTLQQDVEFGLVQLTDIAVRALSPGVNDPTTACDVTVHIGNVLLAIWEREMPPSHLERDGRTVVMDRPSHAAYLARSIGPIARYGAADPEVMSSIVRTLGLVRSEALRRHLPGPLAPIDEAITDAASLADTDSWSATDVARFESLVASERASRALSVRA